MVTKSEVLKTTKDQITLIAYHFLEMIAEAIFDGNGNEWLQGLKKRMLNDKDISVQKKKDSDKAIHIMYLDYDKKSDCLRWMFFTQDEEKIKSYVRNGLDIDSHLGPNQRSVARSIFEKAKELTRNEKHNNKKVFIFYGDKRRFPGFREYSKNKNLDKELGFKYAFFIVPVDKEVLGTFIICSNKPLLKNNKINVKESCVIVKYKDKKSGNDVEGELATQIKIKNGDKNDSMIARSLIGFIKERRNKLRQYRELIDEDFLWFYRAKKHLVNKRSSRVECSINRYNKQLEKKIIRGLKKEATRAGVKSVNNGEIMNENYIKKVISDKLFEASIGEKTLLEACAEIWHEITPFTTLADRWKGFDELYSGIFNYRQHILHSLNVYMLGAIILEIKEIRELIYENLLRIKIEKTENEIVELIIRILLNIYINKNIDKIKDDIIIKLKKLTKNKIKQEYFDNLEIEKINKTTIKFKLKNSIKLNIYAIKLVNLFNVKFVSMGIEDEEKQKKTILHLFWVLTALSHDIAYPLELSAHMAKDFVKDILHSEQLEKFARFDFAFLLTNLFSKDNYYEKLLDYSILTKNSNYLRSKALISLIEIGAHSSLSPVLLWNKIETEIFLKKKNENNSNVFGGNSNIFWKTWDSLLEDENIRRETMKICGAAIMVHHAVKWIDDSNIQYERNEWQEEIKERHNLIKKIKFAEEPFSFLLAICDTVQEWGRPSNSIYSNGSNQKRLAKISDAYCNLRYLSVEKKESGIIVSAVLNFINPFPSIGFHNFNNSNEQEVTCEAHKTSAAIICNEHCCFNNNNGTIYLRFEGLLKEFFNSGESDGKWEERKEKFKVTDKLNLAGSKEKDLSKLLKILCLYINENQDKRKDYFANLKKLFDLNNESKLSVTYCAECDSYNCNSCNRALAISEFGNSII